MVHVDTPTSGYCRRDIIELAEGESLADALVLMERVCAHAGQSYRFAACLAAENAVRSNKGVARPALFVRALFAELERLNSALWTLSEIARAVDLRQPHAEALDDRERVFAAASEATGERAFWGVVVPGGVRTDLDLAPISALADELSAVVERWRVATAPQGRMRRATRGIGAPDTRAAQAEEAPHDSPLAPVGSGADLRKATGYDGYGKLNLDLSALDAFESDAPDVATRAAWLVAQMKLSAEIIQACVGELGDAPKIPKPDFKMGAGRGVARVQSPHGPARVELTLTATGEVEQLRLETPCAGAIAAIPTLLTGRGVDQAPALLAALDLCPSSADM